MEKGTKRWSKEEILRRRHNASTCFAMISKDRMAANSKIFDSSKMLKTTKQRIKIWIANMLGIKKEDL